LVALAHVVVFELAAGLVADVDPGAIEKGAVGGEAVFGRDGGYVGVGLGEVLNAKFHTAKQLSQLEV
jgi:hypothetical protein